MAVHCSDTIGWLATWATIHCT